MEKYTVNLFRDAPLWSEVKEEKLGYSNWDSQVKYNTFFKICLVKNKGFFIKMKTNETDLRMVCSGRDESVWEDSCMEFFIKPFNDRGEYLNFEMNPKGAYLCAFGVNRDNRVFIKDLTAKAPTIKTEISALGWELELFIPFELINEVYSKEFDCSSEFFTANFYKCGDKTKKVHYDSYCEMTTLPPGFHNPECFGVFEIKERGIK